MIEVEIRAKLDNPELFVEEMRNRNAEFLGELIQNDSIYSFEKPGDPIKENTIMGRIREENGKVKVEFKEVCRERGAALEVNTNISERVFGERLLSKLGLNNVCEINKTRNMFSVDGFNVCVDHVRGLGDFVEVEKMVGTDEETEKAKESCIRFLRDIIGDVKLERPYGDLLLEARKNGDKRVCLD